MAAKRVAVVLIPNFAMAVFGRTQHSRAHGAIALVEVMDETSPVTAINQTAAEAGITCGMTTAQAQAFCPGLAIYERDLITERAEAHAITGWLGSLSPTVHEETPGRYRLDASGMSLLYPDEAAYAEKIITTLRPFGYTLQIGLAQNPFVARVAAERAEPDEYLIIPTHEEKAFLSGLRREYLEMSAGTASLLHDLGIEQISQVSAFPINEMTERFGGEGNTLVTLARGENPHRHSREGGNPSSFVGRRSDATSVAEKPDILSPDQFTATRFFSSPLEQTHYLRRHINHLLGHLLEQLKPLGQGCACVEIILHLDNRTDQLISLAVDKPTLSIRPFMRQWQTQSEKLTLDSGIAGLTVTIPHLHPLLIEQMALNTHRAVSAAPVAWPDTVYRPCLRPGFLPESCFELLPCSSSKKMSGGAVASGLAESGNGRTRCDLTRPENRQVTRPADGGPQDLPERRNPSSRAKQSNHLWQSVGLRLLQPPRLVRMQIEKNRPIDIIWAGRHRAIIRTLGPWELSGHWWRAMFHRRYYEIMIDTRQRYLIFCEEGDTRWFMQGVFD